MNKIESNVANNIKFLRKRNNLYQKELGEKINKSESAICQYEKGIREPDTEALFLLSKVFNVSIEQLVNGNLQFEKITEQKFDEEIINILKNMVLDKLASVDNQKKKEILDQLGWTLMSIAKEMK